MNVYSIRLLPSLKLKLCEFFGFASTLAVEELTLRLERLEHKIDQVDSKLRRGRPVLALPEVLAIKKKPSYKKTKSKVSKRPSKQPRLVVSQPVLEATVTLKEEAAPLAGAPVSLPLPLPEERPFTAHFEEAVFLIQPEEATRRVVQEYFGSDIKLIELESALPLKLEAAGRRVLAVIFDRALLGNPEAREIFEAMSQDSPDTRMIGLSSYLTLAFAESMPERSDFATLLTLPLSAEALAGLFEPEAKEAIS